MGTILTEGSFTAEIMADSFVRVPRELNSKGSHRITTIRIEFPRIVLAELNTHRLFSRNSASSRAIPAKQMRARAVNNPFIPNRFPLDHTGMQASEWVESTDERYQKMVSTWLKCRDTVVAISEELSKENVSKQLGNRFVEPVLMHQVIVTATEWENFFALRVDEAAQNEIRIIAELMLKAMNESCPVELQPKQWHLPFGDKLDEVKLKDFLNSDYMKAYFYISLEELRRMVIVARCARVSYFNFQGKDDFQADFELFTRLKHQGHMSPFEHVARAMTSEEYGLYSHTYPTRTEYGWCANFRGFVQMRKLFESEIENRHDSRLKPVKL